MMNFVNNGGLELMLTMGYLAYIGILVRLENKRIIQKKNPEKWTWE